MKKSFTSIFLVSLLLLVVGLALVSAGGGGSCEDALDLCRANAMEEHTSWNDLIARLMLCDLAYNLCNLMI